MEKQYIITENQLKMINILIKITEVSINRNNFTEEEIEKIKKTIKILNSNPTKL